MITRAIRLSTQRELLAYTGQRLQVFGFNPKANGQDFYKKGEKAKWAFHLSFIPHPEDFDITIHVAVRIHDIENLVNQYDMKIRPSAKKSSMTLGVELGNLSQGRPIRFTLDEVEEIPKVGDALMALFERVGWPFLERHSDLPSTAKVLTGEDRRDTLLAPFMGPRYMAAVAATYLLGESQKLLSLVPLYETRLRERNDLYLDSFLALCRGIGVMPS